MTEPRTDRPAVSIGDEADTREIRVGWVAGGDTLSRLESVLRPSAVGLMDELVRVVLVRPERPADPPVPQPVIQELTYRRGGWWHLRRRALRRMAEELGKQRVELLHALDASAVPLTRELAHATGRSYVVSCFGAAGRLGRLDARCRAVMAGSDDVQRRLLERRVAPADRVFLSRPGVVRLPDPQPGPAEGLLPSVVACGPLDSFAPWDAVLRAFGILHGGGEGYVFFIVGSGRAERRLRRRSAYLNLQTEVTFVPAQHGRRLAGILRDADLYVNPVAGENVDVQALQALAMRVPVLSVAGAASDFLRDGRTCVEVPPGDAEALAGAVERLLGHPEEMRRLTGSALDYLREHHNPEAAAARTAKLYRSALSA